MAEQNLAVLPDDDGAFARALKCLEDAGYMYSCSEGRRVDRPWCVLSSGQCRKPTCPDQGGMCDSAP